MESHIFDQYIDRANTNSVKWDQFRAQDVIPLTIADMDFPVPPCITERLSNRLKHGIYGYSHRVDLVSKIKKFLLNEYDWVVNSEDILIIPSVVNALNLMPQILMNNGGHAIIPAPVYEKIFKSYDRSTSHYSFAKLDLLEGRWTINFSDLERQLNSSTQVLMLCNPHNPVGTVYKRTELEKIGDFCRQNNLLICSDEIHAPLVIDKLEKHIPIASINADLSNRTITLMSLNKVFNISGIGLGWCVCSNQVIREKIINILNHQSLYPNIFAYEAACAALDDGDSWRRELLEYLWGNQLLIREWLQHRPEFFLGSISCDFLGLVEM